MARMTVRAELTDPHWLPGPATLADAWRRPRAVPVLWDRATAMLDVLLVRFGRPAELARQGQATRRTLRTAELWLKPVEKLVRMLLICRAISLLVMTGEGGALLRGSAKIALPVPRTAPDPPPLPARPPARTSVPYPGFATLARHWVPEPPPPLAKPAFDPADPSKWRCRFPVLSRPGDGGAGDRIPPPPPISAYVRRILAAQPGAASAQLFPEPDRLSTLSLARRIEALARVLRNPAPAVRRLARYIARLPEGALGMPGPARQPPARWEQGRFEHMEAVSLASRAIEVLDLAAPPPPDPG